MKIRGKAIDEVIKFSFIEHLWKREISQNTNIIEVEFIIAELKKLKEIEGLSVGIITPHTNQQKLLIEKINKIPKKRLLLRQVKTKNNDF